MFNFLQISSKAPCRVDLAGATLDIWPLYLFHDNVVTVNFAVDRYTYCNIAPRDDSRIVLRSRDLAREETFESFADLYAARRYRLPLLALLVRFFAPERGLTLESDSEAPAGAGISGSSALMISVASALNQLTGRKYKLEKIREIAQNVEAQVIQVPTGAQDYYPAMYGGVSAIEPGPAGIVRTSLPVDAEDLDRRFVLAYTGAPRNSGINNWEVMKGHIDGDQGHPSQLDRIAAIATLPCGRRLSTERLGRSGTSDTRRVDGSAKERSGDYDTTDRSSGCGGAAGRQYWRESLRRGRRGMRSVSGRTRRRRRMFPA